MDRRTFLATASCLTAFSPSAFAGDPTQAEIQKLIERLGGRKFAEREEASRALEKIGEPALPALRKTAKGGYDAEARRRAKKLVVTMEQRLELVPGLVRKLVGHTDAVWRCALSRNGRLALSSSLRERVNRLWDVNTGKELNSFAYGQSWENLAVLVDFCANDRQAYLWSQRCLRYIEIPSGRSVRYITLKGSNLVSAAVSGDGRQGVSGHEDGTMRLWDLPRGRQRRCYWGHSGPVDDVAFMPNGNLVSTGKDKTIRVWDTVKGTQAGCLRGHQGEVWSVAVSPRGRCAVSGGLDHTVRIWDLRAARELRCLRYHQDCVFSVAISPDGRRVLSGGNDSAVRLCDAGTGEQLQCFTGHNDAVNCVTFSHDGRLALSCSDDKTLGVWRLPS